MQGFWRQVYVLIPILGALASADAARAQSHQINFDDLGGTGIRAVAPDRYGSTGLQLSTDGAGLFVFGPSAFAPSAPDWLFGSQTAAGGNADANVTLRFLSPVNGTPAVTENVAFTIADGDHVGAWTVRGYDVNNAEIALVTGTTASRVRLTGKPIHRVVFTPSADFDGIDSLEFNEVVAPGELEFATFVRFGAPWRYWHPLTNADPSAADADFHTTWFKNDGSYNGPAFLGPFPSPLGYGGIVARPTLGKDIGTPPSGSRYTAYFTTTFDVADASLVRTLAVDLLADDGAFIYLNGRLVATHNIAAGGADTYRQLAADVEVNGVNTEDGTFTLELDPAALIDGTNFLAVSVHNQGNGSSDLGFDLQMSASLLVIPEPAGASLSLAAISSVLIAARVSRRWRRLPKGGGSRVRFASPCPIDAPSQAPRGIPITD
jgi:hypothetical protein